LENSITSILCVSKYKSRWHHNIEFRFINAGYLINFIYLDLLLDEVKTQKRRFKINDLIKKIEFEYSKIGGDYILYDLEFSTFLTPYDIETISISTKTKSVAFLLDDDVLHNINKVFFTKIDKLLVNGLLTKNTYESYGFNALDIVPFEIPKDIKIDQHNTNLFDNFYVLHYGDSAKADRMAKLIKLKEAGINVKILNDNLSYNQLSNEIKMAPLVINFTKSFPQVVDPLSISPFSPWNYFKTYRSDKKNFIYQYKGRPFEAAFLDSFVISEIFPFHEMIFENKMPVFRDDNEMIQIVKAIFANPELLIKKRIEFIKFCKEKFNEDKLSVKLKEFLSKKDYNHCMFSWNINFEISVRLTRFQLSRNLIYIFRNTNNFSNNNQNLKNIFATIFSFLILLKFIISGVLRRLKHYKK